MENIKYIHYGSNSFDPTEFQPIKNIPFYTKPGRTELRPLKVENS